MSVILITEELYVAWRDRQIRLQQGLLASSLGRSPFPIPGPVLEEFGSFLTYLARITTRYEVRRNSLRLFEFDREFYDHAALEARRLEIPHDDLWPIASLCFETASIGHQDYRLTHPIQPWGIYVFRRPTSYLSGLATLSLPERHSPEFGLQANDPHAIELNPVLPNSFCETPLLCANTDGSTHVFAMPGIFDASEISQPDHIEHHIPNNQLAAFYEGIINRQNGLGYMKFRKCHYTYAPEVELLQPAEIDRFFNRIRIGCAYRFPYLDVVAHLIGIGVSSRILQDALSRTQGQMPVSTVPVPVSLPVMTDVPVPIPPGGQRSATTRSLDEVFQTRPGHNSIRRARTPTRPVPEQAQPVPANPQDVTSMDVGIQHEASRQATAMSILRSTNPVASGHIQWGSISSESYFTNTGAPVSPAPPTNR